MPSVLFICTANICRSPMAAGIFKGLIEDRQPLGEWQVESAGTWGLDGEPAATGSLRVMQAIGIDISKHRARSVNAVLLQEFDLILTMELSQKESIRMEFPETSEKIFLLSEMVDRFRDVEDPYGGTFSEYEFAAGEIKEYLEQGYGRIAEKATIIHDEKRGL